MHRQDFCRQRCRQHVAEFRRAGRKPQAGAVLSRPAPGRPFPAGSPLFGGLIALLCPPSLPPHRQIHTRFLLSRRFGSLHLCIAATVCEHQPHAAALSGAHGLQGTLPTAVGLRQWQSGALVQARTVRTARQPCVGRLSGLLRLCRRARAGVPGESRSAVKPNLAPWGVAAEFWGAVCIRQLPSACCTSSSSALALVTCGQLTPKSPLQPVTCLFIQHSIPFPFTWGPA